MIYIKQYNSLFDSPRVEEPTEQRAASYIDMDYLERVQYDQDRNAYNKWLSSETKVIGDHTWQDLQEVIEGVDYELCDHEDAHYFHENAPRYCPKCNKYIDGNTTYAIPITLKP